MPRSPSSSLRARLEQRAELIEATRLRYRALRHALGRLWWRDRVRRLADVLRATADAEPALEDALGAALRRAEAEGWPAHDPWVQCLHEVRDLREEVTALAARRLRAAPDRGGGLERMLRDLEEAVSGPRKVLPGQRWAAALELLPATLPPLRALAEDADFIERLFQRPFEAGRDLPLSIDEAAELAERLPRAEAVLAGLWERVQRCDPSRGLLRFLQRRARRAPLGAPTNGPERFLRAAFWADVARARLRAVAEARFTPLAVTDEELIHLIPWVVERERDPDARLPAAKLGEGRAAVLELAHELWKVPKESPALGRSAVAAAAPRRMSPQRFARLLERARRADAAPPSPGAERLREAVWMFVRIRAGATGPVPRAPAARTFEALLSLAR